MGVEGVRYTGYQDCRDVFTEMYSAFLTNTTMVGYQLYIALFVPCSSLELYTGGGGICEGVKKGGVVTDQTVKVAVFLMHRLSAVVS